MKSLTTILVLLVSWGVALAQQPSTSIGVSGLLRDPGGAPLVGPVDLEMRIYDRLTAGNLLWSESHLATPLDAAGRYHVDLSPLTPSLLAGTETWLTLVVGIDNEMAPRLPLGRTPAVFNSDRLAGSPASAFAARAALQDLDPSSSPVHWGGLVGTPAGLADGTDDLNDADTDPVGELNAGVDLLGTTLRLSDAGGVLTEDLAALVDDADADPTGELISSVTLGAGALLEITDVGGTLSADLSSLQMGTPVGAAGGALSGAYPAPELAPDVASSVEIVDGSITTGDLELASVDSLYLNTAGDTVTGELYVEGVPYLGATLAGGDHHVWFDHPTTPEFMRYSASPVGFEFSSDLAVRSLQMSPLPQHHGCNLGPSGTPGFLSYDGDSLYVEHNLEIGSGELLLGEPPYGTLHFFDGVDFDKQLRHRQSYRFELWDIGITPTDLTILGSVSKMAGTFRIDHPLDPEGKFLDHSFVESPDMMNVYNGNIDLDSSGEVWVEMPEWFDALNDDLRYHLTAIGAPGRNLHVAVEMAENRFKIAGGSPGARVSWQVTGVRQDPWARDHRVQPEVEKSDIERGLYLYPPGYGQPQTSDLGHAMGDGRLGRPRSPAIPGAKR